ncbi:MAG: nitroreductase family protein [Candidatus Thorarchaeota archaeon]|jgi:nitroreductase
MDFMEIIKGRRSIRKYLPTEVEDEKVKQILESGQWAPSASNKQPWHFIVVRNEETRRLLADAHAYGRFMAESPVVIVVLGNPDIHPKYHLADPHNAVQNMILTAYHLGLGTCWMGVRDTEIESRFRELLKVPDNYRVVCSISVGYHDVKPTRTRKPLEDIVSYETFE